MPPNHTAILLMAYGSPNRLEEVEAYFTDIRGGRTPSSEAVEELAARYRRVGVPTPLLAISMELGRLLERQLSLNPPDEAIYTVHLGMKHWTPRIATAIDEIVESGADRVIAIVLAPHYSKISIAGYRRQVEQALNGAAPDVGLEFVESWHELDGYLQAVAENVQAVHAEFPKAIPTRSSCCAPRSWSRSGPASSSGGSPTRVRAILGSPGSARIWSTRWRSWLGKATAQCWSPRSGSSPTTSRSSMTSTSRPRRKPTRWAST
jgi:hypothetical protein